MFFSYMYFLQFLAHDTDLSGNLPSRDFADVFSDVWLPIEVPKVSSETFLVKLADIHKIN